MADRSSPDTGLEQLEILLENEENYCRMLALQRNQAAGAASESASSTTTTPGPLDTAFLNETNTEDQHGQISLSAAQSQTARDASLTVYGMIDTLLERQPTTIRLRSAMPTMVSTGTDPKTPIKMTSFGTMPKTPVAAIATTSLSVSPNDIIDLSSPTVSAIDPQSPSGETIDLCTPNTPTNTGSPP